MLLFANVYVIHILNNCKQFCIKTKPLHAILSQQRIQEAQLLLGWPTHGDKLIDLLGGQGHRIKLDVTWQAWFPSPRHETPHAIFNVMTLK